jgi:hypothetical protein
LKRLRGEEGRILREVEKKALSFDIGAPARAKMAICRILLGHYEEAEVSYT